MQNYKLSDFVDVPSLVREARNKKRYSQVRLARKVGISDKSISTYENGKNTPPLEVFIKILKACDFVLDIKEDIYKSPKKIQLPNA